MHHTTSAGWHQASKVRMKDRAVFMAIIINLDEADQIHSRNADPHQPPTYYNNPISARVDEGEG